MYCGISTWNPNAAATARACTAFAIDTSRRANTRSGSNGARAVHCRTTNPASSTTAAPPLSSVCGEPQPYRVVPAMAKTPSIRPLVTRTAPAASAPARRPMPGSSASTNQPAATAATPNGTLTKKIQCQLRAWVSTPPSTRPSDAPPAPVKLYTPIAFARSGGDGNSLTIMPRLTAEAIAPPAPWTNRATTSTGWLSARPQASDASVNRTRPATKTRLPPTRSPSRPTSSSRPPKAIRYPFTTHSRPVAENPRSRWIDGRATVTMVPSRMIIKVTAQSTASASQRDCPIRAPSALASDMPSSWCTICYPVSICYRDHDV